MLVILRRGGVTNPAMWDMLQTTSSHRWAVGDKTNSMRFATSLEEVWAQALHQAPGPSWTGGGGGSSALPRSGSPGGRGESVGARGQGRGPGRSVSAGRAPHKASRVGELRESDEGSLLLLPFRCAAAQLGKASASG